MIQSYELRGRIAFLEDMVRAAADAFKAGDEGELVGTLTAIKTKSIELIEELKSTRN